MRARWKEGMHGTRSKTNSSYWCNCLGIEEVSVNQSSFISSRGIIRSDHINMYNVSHMCSTRLFLAVVGDNLLPWPSISTTPCLNLDRLPHFDYLPLYVLLASAWHWPENSSLLAVAVITIVQSLYCYRHVGGFPLSQLLWLVENFC